MMVKFFSWLLVFSIGLYFISILIIPFFNENLIPFFLLIAVGIGVISLIALLIFLVRERIKDKKEEDANDDLSKY